MHGRNSQLVAYGSSLVLCTSITSSSSVDDAWRSVDCTTCSSTKSTLAGARLSSSSRTVTTSGRTRVSMAIACVFENGGGTPTIRRDEIWTYGRAFQRLGVSCALHPCFTIYSRGNACTLFSLEKRHKMIDHYLYSRTDTQNACWALIHAIPLLLRWRRRARAAIEERRWFEGRTQLAAAARPV